MAGLLNKPIVIVCFSMGGLVTRDLILKSMEETERNNVKGVLFLACHGNGHSEVIWIEEGFNSSGARYADMSFFFNSGEYGVHSVRMPRGVDSWAEFYTDANFEGKSYMA